MTIFGSRRSDRTARAPGVRRRTVVGLIAMLPVLAVLGTVAPAGAGNGHGGGGNGGGGGSSGDTPQVTLCHRTNNDNKPYGPKAITIDANAVVKDGHDGHEGPVWNPTLKADHIKWGDIIPTFDWVDKDGQTQHYAGMNTDALDVIANGCQILTVTPVAPTVVPSTTCDVQGTYTIPATKGVVYLLDGTAVAAGTYNGPKTATVTAQAKPGYLLSDPTWSYQLNLPAAAVCPTSVTPVNPTVVPSSVCEVQGTYTIPATTGIDYLLGTTVIAAGTYKGPASGTVTAQPKAGYALSTTSWSYALSLPAAAACPQTVVVVATPVNPTVAPSTTCEVQGTYTIPVTTGITYLLDGTAVAGGTYKGPASGTVTAQAKTDYTLSTTTWSYALTLSAAEICPAAVEAPTETVTPAGTTVPAEAAAAAEPTSALPKTGAPTTLLAAAGALALLLGLAMLAVGTRRPRADLS